jgi:tRNA pseudouridine13 synthase
LEEGEVVVRPAPPFDKALGMDWYITDTEPCGGVVKERPEDFVVEEILEDGTVVSLSGVALQQRPGPWLWVHVVKRGVDTLSLLIAIERRLGVRRGELTVGGIKDTRAVTSQIISIYGARPEDLPKIDGVEYRDFWSMDEPISPQKIYGNRFTIVVRRINGACASKALEEAPRLPNYYGYQRFGSIRPVTHVLGRALVKRDPEAFLETMFCKVFEGESPAVKRARELACMGKYADALSQMPKAMLEEREVLKALASRENLWNAVMSIPRRILRIYIEAYQSYIFNKVLSARLALGEGALDEDLVLINDAPVVASAARGAGEVVLPVPGPGIRIPESVARDLLLRVLREEGVSLADFAVPPLGASGSYRRMWVRPRWLRREVKGDEALLSFDLPRGSYATVVLREVIKPEAPAAHGL